MANAAVKKYYRYTIFPIYYTYLTFVFFGQTFPECTFLWTLSMLSLSKVFISLTSSVNCLAVETFTASLDNSQNSFKLFTTSFCAFAELVLSKACSNASVVLFSVDTKIEHKYLIRKLYMHSLHVNVINKIVINLRDIAFMF